MAGLAGQDHQAGILHKIQVWGCDARLGHSFWKYMKTQDGGQGPFACLPFIRGPQGLPVYAFCGWCVCVCVLCIRPYCGGGTSKPFVSVLCDNSVNVLWVLCVERVCGVWMYLCVCVLYVYVL